MVRRPKVGDRVACYVRNEPFGALGTILTLRKLKHGSEAKIKPDHKPSVRWYLQHGAIEGYEICTSNQPGTP
jgi:hypothetical protein